MTDDRSDPGFAAVLREGTEALHREAERSGYVADLIRGRATPQGYALYLRSLLPVYAAMEAAAHGMEGDVRTALADPALARAPALRDDIVAITGKEPEALPLLPAAAAYAEAVAGAGAALAGHAYARYLGDLSGGQILKPLLARTLGLGPEALAFYDFPGIVDIAAAKGAIRRALDTIEPGTAAAARVLDGAMASFRHTILVSTAVAAATTSAPAGLTAATPLRH